MARYSRAVCLLIVLVALIASVASRRESTAESLISRYSFKSERFYVSSDGVGMRKRDVSGSCSEDNNVCAEILNDETGQFTNNAYIEMSLQVKFPVHKNIIIYGPDGKKVTNWVVRTVLPAREPGGEPTVTTAFTMKPAKPEKEYNWEWDFTSKFGSFKAKHNSKAKYRLPFAGTRKVAQGYNGKATHFGENAYSIDFTMPEGSRILAPRDGVVAAVEQSNYRSKFEPGLCPKPVTKKCNADGSEDNHIFLRYEDGTIGMFAHLKQDGAVVSVGDSVTAGQLLGYSGNTGLSNGPHLHVAVAKATPFGFARGWLSESIQVSYVDAKGKTVTPKAGSSYEGAPEP